MKPFKILFFIIILLGISNCSNGPSIEEAQQYFYDKGIEGKKELIKIINFHKTKYYKESGPVLFSGKGETWTHYTMYFEAKIEFTNECYYSVFEFMDIILSFKVLPKSTIENDQFDRRNIGTVWKFAKKGHKITIPGMITFYKTEKGWKAE